MDIKDRRDLLAGLFDIQALYVHIPFCRKKCHYCDFVSFLWGDLPVGEYLEALLMEGKKYQNCFLGNRPRVKSLYLGGGTPTSLPVKDLVGLISAMKDLFPIVSGGEITVEANPGTINQGYLAELKNVGVNRLSIGAQAFEPLLLEEMGREHGVDDITKAVLQAKNVGFSNISLDLIYGLPGQTISQWLNTLEKATALPVNHLSVYGLKLSDSSPWGRAYLAGTLSLPDEDLFVQMQDLAIDYLENKGFIHYEISNFAQPGFFSMHNQVYWENNNYLGLGVGGASHFGSYRKTNDASPILYIKELALGHWPKAEWEVLSKEVEIAETIFLGLRLMSGISFDSIKKRYDFDFLDRYQKQIGKLVKLGLIASDGTGIKLTKKGIFLANEVFVEFLP